MKLRNIINQAFFQAIIASFSLGLGFACAAQAQAQKPAASVTEVSQKKAPAQKKVPTKAKVKAKRDVFGPFVPPPPPNIPTFSSIGEMGSIDIDLSGLSFLSESELKSRLASSELRLKNAQSRLKDQTSNVEESKKRAASFIELFEQGIVSKKELEGSSKDADQAVSDLEEAKGKVKDLELMVRAIKERMSVIQKRKANSKLVGFSENRKQNKSKLRPPSKQKSESKSSQAETTSDKSKK